MAVTPAEHHVGVISRLSQKTGLLGVIFQRQLYLIGKALLLLTPLTDTIEGKNRCQKDKAEQQQWQVDAG